MIGREWNESSRTGNHQSSEKKLVEPKIRTGNSYVDGPQMDSY